MYIRLLPIFLLLFSACYVDQTPLPSDLGGWPGDGTPCDSNTVYFQNTILPLLVSNCGMSGCHDAASAEEGVVLTNYNAVMNTGDIAPFNPNEGDLMEVITETNPNKLMPPPPRARLTAQQVNLIRTWINQGALNNACDEAAGGCDTLAMSFSADIGPILQGKCLGCHNGQAPAGGVNLSTYNGILGPATNGLLLSVGRRETGYRPMPPSGPGLSPCEIRRIAGWIQQGALNN